MMLQSYRSLRLAAIVAVGTASLSGCIPVLIGGVAAGTVVAVDRRDSGTQLQDKTIGLKAENQISKQFGNQVRINALSYDNRLLLTGDVPTQDMKDQITHLAQGIENVKAVINQMTVGPIESLGDRTNDGWLTSKVDTALVNAPTVPSRTITVTTDHSVVYMMGRVTEQEGNYAAQTASSISGVQRVVKLFDIVTPEEAQADEIRAKNGGASSDSSNSTPSSNVPSAVAPADGGVQAMPIQP